MTPPEIMLWQRLRGRPAGLKFRRQHPIDPYVVDFCCRAARLVIEVDGEIHNDPDVIERDERRTSELIRRGYQVARFSGADIMRSVDEVAASIVALAAAERERPDPPSVSPSGCHLPVPGRSR